LKIGRVVLINTRPQRRVVGASTGFCTTGVVAAANLEVPYMPPINQGSRTALVTATVVLSIVAVTTTVFAIYFYVRAANIEETANAMSAQYRDIVATAALTSEDINQLKQQRGTDNFPKSMSVLDVALKQRDMLGQRLAGTSGFSQPMSAAEATLAQLANLPEQETGVPGVPAITADNAVGALNAARTALLDRQTEINNLNEQVQLARSTLEQERQNLNAERELVNKRLAEARAQASQAVQGADADRGTKDEQYQQLIGEYNAAVQAASENAQQLTVQIQDLTKRLESSQREINTLREKLGGQRVQTAASVVRQPDGRIVRVTGQNVVYIDLGQGDQITPGLTFQVFDRAEGIPAPGDPTTNENLPRGKASIEVTRVSPTSSEARVVNVQPGQALAEGDLIVNLVYDRNTKYNFLVYGNFDLDQNGVATPEDADVIRRLITQWGGALTDQVNVNTDFVVLGVEPQVPTFTREDLEDPINLARYNEAQEQLQQYQDVLAAARSMHVPILNQNRFLYFVGFYELARR
jgi:hypothetical protein